MASIYGYQFILLVGDTLRVRYLSQERNYPSKAPLGPFDPQSSSLTFGPNVFQYMKIHRLIK